jgi:uroporphyrinogen III methyltransferase/synthase
VVCPLIAFSPPSDWAPVDRCLERLSKYDGLIFTSANAVGFMFRRIEERGIPKATIQGIPAYAVGPATAEALAARGIAVPSLPEQYQAEGLASVLARDTLKGKRFLFPRARKAREWLPGFLEERGARVDLAVVYETRYASENQGLLRRLLKEERLDFLTFTSSSTVGAFGAMAGPDATAAAWKAIPAACIGEITAEAARAQGFRHVLGANPSTIAGLVEALVDYVRTETGRTPG